MRLSILDSLSPAPAQLTLAKTTATIARIYVCFIFLHHFLYQTDEDLTISRTTPGIHDGPALGAYFSSRTTAGIQRQNAAYFASEAPKEMGWD